MSDDLRDIWPSFKIPEAEWRKHRYWWGHRQGHCPAVHPEGDTCDRPEVHEGRHKDAGTGKTWTTSTD